MSRSTGPPAVSVPIAYLVRHCSTQYTAEGRLQGKLDVPLSAEGRAEAAQNVGALRLLRLTRIVASPLKRARQTATMYARALGICLQLDERLQELDHGVWEGELFVDLLGPDRWSYGDWLREPGAYTIPGSPETVQTAQRRMVACVVDHASACPGETLLFVSHKHALAALWCALRNVDLREFSEQVDEGLGARQIPREAMERLACRQRKKGSDAATV